MLYRSLILLFYIWLSTGCTYSSLAVKGRVYDYNTKQPIANAIVIVMWNATISHMIRSYSSCYNMEIVVSDEDGKYKTKPWLIASDNAFWAKNRSIYAFKEGFDFKYDDDNNDVYMKPFAGTQEQYFEFLRSRSKGASFCDGDPYNAQKRYKLLVRTMAEMKRIAINDEQKKVANDEIFYIREAKVNYNKPNKYKENVRSICFVSVDVNGKVEKSGSCEQAEEDKGGYQINIDPKDNYSEDELNKW